MVVTFQGERYEFVTEDALSSLTGTESIMLEEYLGGWGNFRAETNSTRSVVVLVWLAKRSAGIETSLDEIQQTPGLMFSDSVLEVDDNDPPAVAAQPAASTDDSSQETSEVVGVPA